MNFLRAQKRNVLLKLEKSFLNSVFLIKKMYILFPRYTSEPEEQIMQAI